jgi:hypothetical protein
MGFIVLLCAEFLWFSQFKLNPYAGPLPTLSRYVITYQNASRWVITLTNPLGQLTSFLVYDGPDNIITLLVSSLESGVLLCFAYGSKPWALGLAYFGATNLAGMLSPTAIYLNPPSNIANWGMSSPTYGALGTVS